MKEIKQNRKKEKNEPNTYLSLTFFVSLDLNGVGKGSPWFDLLGQIYPGAADYQALE